MQIIIESNQRRKHGLVDVKSKINMIGKKHQANKTPTASLVCTNSGESYYIEGYTSYKALLRLLDPCILLVILY